MKILLADNVQGYNNALYILTDKMARVQAALTAYAALGVAALPTTADLPDLLRNPALFLGRMLTGSQPVAFAGGLAVAPDKVYDLLQKPAGAEAFFATVASLREPSGGWTSQSIDPTVYELAGGTLQIRQAVLDNLREQFRLYATNQKQKDEWDALQTVAATLETIRQNGNFGNEFDAPDYLRQALVSEGRANALNPLKVNTAYVVRAARLQV